MSESGSGRKRRWSFSIPEEKALTELGPYEIVGPLGKGSQGEVYRAKDPSFGREVALKVLRARTATAQARFQREAEATAALDHPGIVRIHASGQEGDLSYVVYELIEGARTLEDAFAERPAPAQVGAWILEAARALGAAHAAGIVHRDLKPGNLLLDAEGKLRVADFGLAQTAEGSSLTASHAAVGTPLYMSPEQIRGAGETGPPADVWGLGVVLYQGLCGELPFQATTMAALAGQVLHGELVPPRARAPETPSALEAVCLRCLERAPGDRYADGAALAASLEDALSASEEARSSWLPGALGALVTILLGVALATHLPSPGGPGAQPLAPADPLVFAKALRAEDWDLASQQADRARHPELWRLRLAAERAASPSELETRFEAAFAPELRGSTRASAIAALCSARSAYLRGEQVLPALRGVQDPPPWLRVAQAEVLLGAGRPHEARDLMAELGSAAALGEEPALSWCDARALRGALDALCSRPLPGTAERPIDWSELPRSWRVAGARWLRAEARHLLEWSLRAEEHPHLALAERDPRPQAGALQERAARLSRHAEDPFLRALLDPLSLAEAEARLPGELPEGSLAALAARRGAARALASPGAPPADLRRWATLLERVRLPPAPERDLWGARTRDRGAQAWVAGRFALALGEVERARVALERSDPLGHHPGVAADALRVAERRGDAAAIGRARERLKRLRGSRREEAQERIQAIRRHNREGPPPAAQLDATLALDPLNRDTDFARVVADFHLGKGAAEDLIRVSERWLFYGSDLHRQFFERCVTLAAVARLSRPMLPLLREQATPLGRWILDALEGEAEGISPEAARALLDRMPDRLAAPGALAPRLTRAFLAIRAGSLGCAEAELDWVLRISPRHSLARFYRMLLLAKRKARPELVRLELDAAIREGFHTQRILTWSPALYPELGAYPSDAGAPLGRTLRAWGWKPRKR